jgi:hypothetical protein
MRERVQGSGLLAVARSSFVLTSRRLSWTELAEVIPPVLAVQTKEIRMTKRE